MPEKTAKPKLTAAQRHAQLQRFHRSHTWVGRYPDAQWVLTAALTEDQIEQVMDEAEWRDQMCNPAPALTADEKAALEEL